MGFSPLKSTSYKPLQIVGLLKIVLYNNSLFRHNSIMILRKVLIMNEFMTFADGVYDCLADLKLGIKSDSLKPEKRKPYDSGIELAAAR